MHKRIALAALAVLWIGGVGCHEVHFEPRVTSGEIGVYDDLFSVSVIDEDHVIAVGYFGAIYTTDDGGASWTKRESETEFSFYGVSMADDQHGWAVGQTGLIVRTEDGGETWVHQPNLKVGEGVHLFSVHAIDADSAWAVGEWGTRLYTEDGGATWEDRSLTIDPQHPQFVWLVPVEQEKVRSGGKVYEDAGLNDVYCQAAPSQKCWIVGEFGYIFYSDDRGETWNRGSVKGDIRVDPVRFGFDQLDPGPDVEPPLRALVDKIVDQAHLKLEIEPVVSAREIAAFVKDGAPEELFDIIEARVASIRTIVEDAGLLSDRIRVVGTPPWDYEDFLEYDEQFLDRYLEGRKAAGSAVQVRVAQNPYLFTVRFRDDEFGIVSSLGGLVLRSTDGGQTWEGLQASPVKQALFSLSLTPWRSLAIGEKGLVRESTDDGVNWAPPGDGFPDIFTFMRDMDFAPESGVGFIVGQEGLVLRSRDGGETWEKILGRDA
jgi:photosystem II stability/assembly factor-like uncharacterized protein